MNITILTKENTCVHNFKHTLQTKLNTSITIINNIQLYDNNSILILFFSMNDAYSYYALKTHCELYDSMLSNNAFLVGFRLNTNNTYSELKHGDIVLQHYLNIPIFIVYEDYVPPSFLYTLLKI